MSFTIASLREQFLVTVVDFDVDEATRLAETIRTVGFQVEKYTSVEEALLAAGEEAPHVVVYDFEKGEHLATHFLRELRVLSDEIKVFLLIAPEQTLSALKVVGQKLAFEFVTKPLVSTLQLTQAIDRAASNLYYQFESEQLRGLLRNAPTAQTEPSSTTTLTTSPTEDSNPSLLKDLVLPIEVDTLNRYLERMWATNDLEETVQIFLEAMSRETGAHVLYMKYLPSHASLLVAQSYGPPIERLRGIGLDLKKEKPQSILYLLREPGRSNLLIDMVKNVFNRQEFAALPHLNDGDGQGIFVILGKLDQTSPRIEATRRVFDIAWKKNLTLKEKHMVDMTDAQTGLINRRFFLQKLDDEISRSRRLLLPLSLLLIDIDGFRRVNERVGYQQADAVLKALGAILKKTTRVSDWVGRTGADEIACLLPHTPHTGAVVKAERIRRIIESTKFPILQPHPDLLPLSVSIGVSEYPSFTNDAEGLLKSADEALGQVRASSGNRVCLATSPLGFKTDFTPRELPPGGGLTGFRRGEM